MPAASASDDIVMRLILKNQEPGEAARLARMPLDAVRAEYAAAAQKIQAGFDSMHAATTKEAQKAARNQIREEQQKTRAVVAALKEIERENEKVAKGISVHWRRTMEDLENVTTVVRGAIDLYGGLKSKLGAFGEEVARTTQIFQSNHVSVEEAKVAIDGTASSLELITAANKATQLELNLSAKQFADVARQAKEFADATGVSSVEALDSLISGLALGKPKMLAHAGVIIDTEKEYQAFAKTLGVTTERLSDEAKKLAVQEAALRSMGAGAAFAAAELEKPKDVAHLIEQQIAASHDAWDKFVVDIGSFQVPSEIEKLVGLFHSIPKAIADAVFGVTVALPAGLKIALGKLKDTIPGGDGMQEAQARAALGAAYEARERATSPEGQRAAAEAKRRANTPFGPVEEPGDRRAAYSDLVNPDKSKGGEYNFLADAMRALEERDERVFLNILKFGKDVKPFGLSSDPSEQDENVANTLLRHNTDFAGSRFSEDEYKQFAAAQGKARDSLYQRHMAARFDSPEFAEGQGKAAASLRDLDAAVKASREKAGGGLLAQVLFGDDTTIDQTYDRLSKAKQFAIESFGEMSQAGTQMADALGQSLAASIGEGADFQKSLKAQTHAVLMALSQQAYVKAIMSAAEAAFALASGNFGSAAGFGAAALGFAAVGTAAAIGARATYSAPASTPTSSSRSAPSYASGSSGGGSSGSGGGGDTTMVFNINGMIGDSEAIVRAIGRGVDEYRRKTGRDPWGNN